MSLEIESGRFVQANGMKIHCHVAGQGAPLVLLHGGGPGAAGWSNYARNIEPLAKQFRVVVIDLPGYGKSDKKSAASNVFEFMSDTVLGVMDALEIPKASFVGNSLGGGTTLKLCVRFPERVERMVLMGPAGGLPLFTSPFSEGAKHLRGYYAGTGPSFEKLKNFLEYLVFDPSQIPDELLRKRFELSTDPEVIANPPLKMLGRSPGDELWRERLNQLTHRTLLVWGREDRTVTLDSSFILLRALPNAQLHVYPSCGHWAQWERADEFNQLVADFISRA